MALQKYKDTYAKSNENCLVLQEVNALTSCVTQK